MSVTILTGGTPGVELGVLRGAHAAGLDVTAFLTTSGKVVGGASPLVMERHPKVVWLPMSYNYELVRAMAERADFAIFVGKEKLRQYRLLAKYAEQAGIPAAAVRPDHDLKHIIPLLVLERGAKRVYVTGDREERMQGLQQKVEDAFRTYGRWFKEPQGVEQREMQAA